MRGHCVAARPHGARGVVDALCECASWLTGLSMLNLQVLAREVTEAYKEGMAAARNLMKDMRSMF